MGEGQWWEWVSHCFLLKPTKDLKHFSVPCMTEMRTEESRLYHDTLSTYTNTHASRTSRVTPCLKVKLKVRQGTVWNERIRWCLPEKPNKDRKPVIAVFVKTRTENCMYTCYKESVHKTSNDPTFYTPVSPNHMLRFIERIHRYGQIWGLKFYSLKVPLRNFGFTFFIHQE